MQIRPATLEDIPSIKKIAEATWPVAYEAVITGEQIRFMLEDMYSVEALKKQFEEGHTFVIVENAGNPAGFASYYLKEEGVIRIPKLYVLPPDQGRGIGQSLVQAIAQQGRDAGAKALELNVNRNNPSVKFYLKTGFKIYREEDIGYYNYVLNDYVMRMELS
jgi:ribosomal protein S18 acetylase RimI-like enzyme